MTINDYVFLVNKERDALDEELKEDYEYHITTNAFCEYAEHLPTDPVNQYGKKNPVWTDGTEILCETEDMAKIIADMFEYITGETHTTRYGYYDPEEDRRDGCVDNHTGWYYVDFD